jgi:hypothetical protein
MVACRRALLVAVDDLGDPYAELVVQDDDLAAGDQRAVDQHVDQSTGRPVHLDDAAGSKGEQVLDRHGGPGQLDRDLHLDAVQQGHG